MTSGSIYIDPDGVSSVSNQMLKAADDIDAMRRSIVSQVNEVIAMSYPSAGGLSGGDYSLSSAQDSIGSFDYRAKTVSQEINTAAHVLNQVAEEGRVMMEQLLRQATMFTVPGQGQGGGVGSAISWLLYSYEIQGVYGLIESLFDPNVRGPILKALEGLFQSEPVKTSADVLGSILTIAQEIAKSDPSLAKSMEGIPWIGPALMLTGTGLDVISNGNYDSRTIGGDLIGAGIAEGLDDIPVVGEVVGVITLAGTVNHLGDMAWSYGEQQYSQLFSGDVKEQLLQTSENLKETADWANPGKVFDSIGLTAYDIQTGNIGQLPSDVLNSDVTFGKFALSFPQTEVGIAAAVTNSSLAGIDKGVSNISFLPTSVKSDWHTATVDTMHVINAGTLGTTKMINDVADAITHPTDTAKKAWDAVTGWL
jgi:hypothetical protein